MIAHDSWWSDERASFNYHRLSSTIIDYHAPFDQGLIMKLRELIELSIVTLPGASNGEKY